MSKKLSEETPVELQVLREKLDVLDSKIVGLLAERFAIIEQVSQVKKKYNIAVQQPGRIDFVLQSKAELARILGVDPELVKKIYTLLISYASKLEKKRIQRRE